MQIKDEPLALDMPPDPAIALAGTSNFRDLGGYTGRDGRRLRRGRLYRSAHLAYLTEGDLATLQALGVSQSVDFRGLDESRHLAYQWPQLRRHALVVEPTVVQRAQALMDAGDGLTAAHAEELMHDTYLSFVQTYGQRFAEFFRLLDASDEPLVFHCTAGKDRTGFAAALILLALGVPGQVVMQDYLLTNELYRMPAPHDHRAPREVLEVLWRVQEDFLNASLRIVEQEDGGVEGYLARALGVGEAERRRLQQLYLQG